jgi:hypothetical protein
MTRSSSATSSDTGDAKQSLITFLLIFFRCVVEQTLTLYPLNSTLTGFRFQSFRFLNSSASDAVYIHCRAFTCALTDKTGNCDESCDQYQTSSNSRRRRRDNQQSLVSNIISDPILIVDETYLLSNNSRKRLEKCCYHHRLLCKCDLNTLNSQIVVHEAL